MRKVKLIKSGQSNTFEQNLNNFLDEIINFQLIDVKFSTSHNGNGTTIIYSALVIYEV
jgi:hypothetical protein